MIDQTVRTKKHDGIGGGSVVEFRFHVSDQIRGMAASVDADVCATVINGLLKASLEDFQKQVLAAAAVKDEAKQEGGEAASSGQAQSTAGKTPPKDPPKTDPKKK